jgi:hypothetical protein
MKPTHDTLTQRIEAAERKAQQVAGQLKELKARKAAIDARERTLAAKRAQTAEKQRKLVVGGLVKQAGLLELDSAALLGALLIEAEKLQDPAYLASTKQRGQADMQTGRGTSAM